MLIPLIITSILALGFLIASLWLFAQRQSMASESLRLSQELTQGQQRISQQQKEIQTLASQLSESRAHVAASQEAQKQLIAQFEKAQQQLKDSFQALAGDALKQSSEQFMHLAKKTFEGEQKDAVAQLEQRKEAIQAAIKPLDIALKQYNESVTVIEKSRNESYGKLMEQVAALAVDQRRLRDETGNLVKALRKPDVRGRWGEMQLRRVAEMAGMIEHCDFSQQVSTSTSSPEGARRPDMVVTLPNDRSIIIDAKTPLEGFLSAIESSDEAERDSFFEQHTRHIETQVRQLASKEYQRHLPNAADFVVLFIPGESFLFPAVQKRPGLIENAMNQGIIIATPTTLISLLKVIAMGWREEQIAENAQKISEAGVELHNRLCIAVEHMQKLGKALDSATGSYNSFVGSFEGRVMVQARRLEELGAASAKKLPQLSTNETITRQPVSQSVTQPASDE